MRLWAKLPVDEFKISRLLFGGIRDLPLLVEELAVMAQAFVGVLVTEFGQSKIYHPLGPQRKPCSAV